MIMVAKNVCCCVVWYVGSSGSEVRASLVFEMSFFPGDGSGRFLRNMSRVESRLSDPNSIYRGSNCRKCEIKWKRLGLWLEAENRRFKA